MRIQRLYKRERLVDELLSSAVYAAHFANTWREVLLSGTNPELRTNVPELESWLRLRFAANTPYDQLAAELIAATYTGPSRRARQSTATIPSPIAFFQANERKPENLAASSSSVFLGVQVQWRSVTTIRSPGGGRPISGRWPLSFAASRRRPRAMQ